MKLESCEQDGEYLCHRGYRTDFLGLDHYGETSPEISACDAGDVPCERHRCYYWTEKHS